MDDKSRMIISPAAATARVLLEVAKLDEMTVKAKLAEKGLTLTKDEEVSLFGENTQYPVIEWNKHSSTWEPHPSHPDNIIYFLTVVLNKKLKWNLLKHAISIDEKEITDMDLSLIRNDAKREGLSADIMDALAEAAWKNKYHPWKEFVERAPYDGTDHISQLFETLIIEPEFEQHRDLYKTYLRRWLIGAIAKVYRPGSQNLVLTFQGFQGAGKSRWCTALAGNIAEVFAEGAIDPSNKDDMLKHLNYVFYHVSELEQVTRKKDQAAVKDYLTKETVACRPAYGRFDRIGKSVCSFIATVNSTDFLNDETGSRRFLCIPLKDINAEHKINVQQIWAQAKALFDSGERWWFDKTEIPHINEANDIFTQKNIVDLIASKIEPGEDFVTAVELFRCFGYKHFNTDISKLGTLLRKSGIASERRTVNKIKLTGYLIKKPSEPTLL